MKVIIVLICMGMKLLRHGPWLRSPQGQLQASCETTSASVENMITYSYNFWNVIGTAYEPHPYWSSVLQRFEHSNVIEKCNRATFNF